MSKRIKKLIKRHTDLYAITMAKAFDSCNPDDFYFAGVQKGVVLGLKLGRKKK